VSYFAEVYEINEFFAKKINEGGNGVREIKKPINGIFAYWL